MATEPQQKAERLTAKQLAEQMTRIVFNSLFPTCAWMTKSEEHAAALLAEAIERDRAAAESRVRELEEALRHQLQRNHSFQPACGGCAKAEKLLSEKVG